MPSRPRTFAASKNAIPSPAMSSLRRTRGIRAQDPTQQSATLLEWLVEQRSTIEEEEVEHLVDERRCRADPAPALDPGLEQREIGLAVVIEGDDLTIDDRLGGGDPGRRLQEWSEVACRVLLAAGQ